MQKPTPEPPETPDEERSISDVLYQYLSSLSKVEGQSMSLNKVDCKMLSVYSLANKMFVDRSIEINDEVAQNMVGLFLKDLSNAAGQATERRLVEPKIYMYYVNCLNALSIVVSRLSEMNLDDSAVSLLDGIANYLIPLMTQKVATVVAKKSQRSLTMQIWHCSINSLQARILMEKAEISIKKRDIDAAINALHQCQDFYSRSSQNDIDDFRSLLKDITSQFKKQYKQDRKGWQKLTSLFYAVDEKFVSEILSYKIYYCWAKVMLLQDEPDVAMAKYFCDMAKKNQQRTSIVKIKHDGNFIFIGPKHIAKCYQEIGDQYHQMGDLNNALNCYQQGASILDPCIELLKSPEKLKINSSLSVNMRNIKTNVDQSLIREFLTDVVAIKQKMMAIKKEAFVLFEQQFTNIDQPTELVNIVCNPDNFTLSLTFQSTVIASKLRRMASFYEEFNIVPGRDRQSVVINDIHMLSAKKVQQSIIRAIKSVQADARRVELMRQRRLAKDLGNDNLAEQVDHSYEYEGDDLDHDNNAPVQKRVRPKSTKSAFVTSEKVVRQPLQELVSWKDKLPSHINEDDVYPIPAPDVMNSAIPKGIFYGYINPYLIDEHDGQILLDAFTAVLARGKIASKFASQGVRPVCGELGHESDYVFKLNISGEDLRLYGRRVAMKENNIGQMVVLIEFDQTLAHKKTLNMAPVKR